MPGQSHLEDRKWLEGTYLPSLSGSVLFIGVREYNDGYYKLVKPSVCFETVDLDAEQAQYGSPYHHVATAESLADGGFTWDHVSAFGLFGMADSVAQTVPEIVAFVRKMSAAAKDTFLFGASTDTLSRVEMMRAVALSFDSSWIPLFKAIIKPSKEHSEMLVVWMRRKNANVGLDKATDRAAGGVSGGASG